MLPYILFVMGLILLVKGADWLVNGAGNLGRHLGISDLAIGLTVVAFGTSLPELVVSVFAGVTGHTDIAIGNVLGSNIANILLILTLTYDKQYRYGRSGRSHYNIIHLYVYR